VVDSLAPIAAAAARSQRVRTWLTWILTAACTTGAPFAFKWVTSRAGRADIEQVRTVATHAAKVVGTETMTAKDVDAVKGKLLERVLELEAQRDRIVAETERHDDQLYERFVSLTAAMTERSAAHRSESARRAVEDYRRYRNDGNPPARAADYALQTKIPRSTYDR
jgi:hypothetical protein